MKRKLASLIIALGLVVCNSLGTSAFAATDSVNQGSCINPDCQEYLSVVLVCYKSKYYAETKTHKSNGQTCTITIYESPYKGEFCKVCGTQQDMPDVDYSRRHYCTERHSSCGLGLVNRPECLADNPYPSVPGL